MIERQDPVAVENLLAIERHVVRAERNGAHGQQNRIGGEFEGLALFALDLDGCPVLETRIAAQGGDLVAGKLVLKHLDLVVQRDVETGAQIMRGQILLDPVGAAVKPALAPAGKVERGLAQSFGRNGAGVNRDPANPAAAFHHQNLLAELGGLNRCAPPGRAAANNDEVVMFHGKRRPDPELMKTFINLNTNCLMKPCCAAVNIAGYCGLACAADGMARATTCSCLGTEPAPADAT